MWKPLQTLYKSFHNTMVEMNMYPNLLLAKISKKFASMFVWWLMVCYMPKLKIMAICSFVHLCVRVSVSVCNFFDAGHSFRYITTKLNPSMCPCPVTMPIVLLCQRSNNLVTGSKSRSNLEINITLSISKLGWRRKAQNIRNTLGYHGYISRSQCHFWIKS